MLAQFKWLTLNGKTFFEQLYNYLNYLFLYFLLSKLTHTMLLLMYLSYFELLNNDLIKWEITPNTTTIIKIGW